MAIRSVNQPYTDLQRDAMLRAMSTDASAPALLKPPTAAKPPALGQSSVTMNDDGLPPKPPNFDEKVGEYRSAWGDQYADMISSPVSRVLYHNQMGTAPMLGPNDPKPQMTAAPSSPTAPVALQTPLNTGGRPPTAPTGTATDPPLTAETFLQEIPMRRGSVEKGLKGDARRDITLADARALLFDAIARITGKPATQADVDGILRGQGWKGGRWIGEYGLRSMLTNLITNARGGV